MPKDDASALEDLRALAESLGPPYTAHWDAWSVPSHELQNPTTADPTRFMQRAVLEMCTATMFEAAGPGYVSGAAQALREVVTLGIIIVRKARNWTADDLHAALEFAWKDHERVFPHPPGTQFIYPKKP